MKGTLDPAVLARPRHILRATQKYPRRRTMQLEELLVLLRLLSPQLRHMMLRALVMISREEEGQRGGTTAASTPSGPSDNPASSNPGIIIIEDWDRSPPPSPPSPPEMVQDGCPHRCGNCRQYFCSRGQPDHTHHSCSSCNERRRMARRSNRRGR